MKPLQGFRRDKKPKSTIGKRDTSLEVVSAEKVIRVLQKNCDLHQIRLIVGSATAKHRANLKRFASAHVCKFGCVTWEEYISAIMENWFTICSNLRSHKITWPFLSQPGVFSTMIYFDKPQYRDAINSTLELLPHRTNSETAIDDFFDLTKREATDKRVISMDDYTEEDLQKLRDQISNKI